MHLQGACLRLQGVSESASAAATSCREKLGIVGLAVAPHGPEDAYESSSECSYCDFSAASLSDGFGPNAQGLVGIVMSENSPSTFNQERA